jgi:hypothetical protein
MTVSPQVGANTNNHSAIFQVCLPQNSGPSGSTMQPALPKRFKNAASPAPLACNPLLASKMSTSMPRCTTAASWGLWLCSAAASASCCACGHDLLGAVVVFRSSICQLLRLWPRPLTQQIGVGIQRSSHRVLPDFDLRCPHKCWPFGGTGPFQQQTSIAIQFHCVLRSKWIRARMHAMEHSVGEYLSWIAFYRKCTRLCVIVRTG